MSCPTLHDLPAPPPGKTGWPWTEASEPLPATMADGSPWPRISIVTPSYNQGDFIEETIRSVLLQGYPNLEYSVIDGGSSDGSADTIRRYSAWLDDWVSERDTGQANAINKGFARCTGSLMSWLNSDDLLLPGALQQLAQAHCQHPDAILLASVTLFSEHGDFVQELAARNVTIAHMIQPWRVDFRWSQPGTYVPRTLHEEIAPLDESLRYVFDVDWLCKMLQRAPTHYLKTSVVRFRMHEASKTAGEATLWLPELERVMQRYWHTLPHRNKSLARAHLEVFAGANPSLSLVRMPMNRRKGAFHLLKALLYDWRVAFSLRFVLLWGVVVTPTPLLRMVRKYVPL
jgi:glycosyltransferase involved in cell wall biosynthesis